MGFGPALALLFIALKLTGYIAWSWFWVLSPIWVMLIIFFVMAYLSVYTNITIDWRR